MYHLTRKFIGDESVDKNLCPIQFYDEFLGPYALTESTHRPETGDYVSALISAEYKYQLFAKVDWEKSVINEIKSQRLYSKDKQGFFDETQNIIGSFEEIEGRFFDLAKNNLDNSLEFYRNNPARFFTT